METLMQDLLLTVERRRIPRRTVTLKLPMPPFLPPEPGGLERGRHRIDQRWRAQTAIAIRNARSRVLGPVEIRMVFDARQRHKPMSSLLKPILDVLVQYGVIDGQSSAIVRKLVLEWGVAESVLVEVVSISPQRDPAAELSTGGDRRSASR